jgi:hypothetical protein
MKRLVASVLFLAIGFGLGWYFGDTRSAATADREVRQEMRAIEIDEYSAALFAMKAIPVVESGESSVSPSPSAIITARTQAMRGRMRSVCVCEP